MKLPQPELTLTVLESKAGFAFAERFLDIELNTPEQHDQDDDTVVASPLARRRGLVNKFQKLVMDIFCDELFMETILETPDEQLDQDLLDTYNIYHEFTTMFPLYELIAIVPVNLTGTIGFITQPKTGFQRRI